MARFPELEKTSADLLELGERLAALHFEPLVKGSQDVRSISWRCRAIANANVLRGEELLHFAILAVNEGAIITAHLLTRALDETLAAVVFSRRRIEAAVASRSERTLQETLDRLTSGNLYMARQRAGYPPPYRIGKMIAETEKYLDELTGRTGEMNATLQNDYGILSEVAHPSHGSFSMYQKFEDGKFHFGREYCERFNSLPWLLSSLRMSASLILGEAERLHQVSDLPPEWPTSN